LIFEERVAFSLGRSVDGDEDCAFVCVVAIDGGEFDKVSFAVGGHGEVADDITIESGSVHVQWRVLSAREGSVDVLGLEISGVQTAETGQCILGACAAGADDQVVVHELRFVDTADSSKRLRFSCCGVEEVVIASVVGGEEKSDRCSTCRCSSKSNMLRITSKLADILLNPLQGLDLIFETVVDTAALDNLVCSQESIRTNTVVEVHDDNIVVARFYETRAIVVRIRVCVESTALNEEVDGQRVVRSGIRRSKDIDEKTILRRSIARCRSGTQTKVSRLSHYIVSKGSAV
jgi:hypothetical protein